jgi:putative addiction module killer protein
METEIRKIEIYVAPSGRAPFSEWLHALKDIQGRAKIRVGIDRLSLGSFGNCRGLGKGIFDLKINYGPGYRIYFGQEGKKILVLVCGGDKDTQAKDIILAQIYWADFKSRKNEKK